jgi:general secretion pathway protein K
VVFGLLLPGVFFSAAQAGGVFALCFGFVCFGLSLLCSRSISVAPVRGSTYFSLQRQRKVGKRKPLTPPAYKCPPLSIIRSGARTQSSLAPSSLVTKQSSVPASRFAPRRRAQPPAQAAVGLVSAPRAQQPTNGYALPTRTQCAGGMNESFVTKTESAKADFVRGPLRLYVSGGHLQAGGVSPLSLLTFFAAAKKVSAAPHRGEANRPLRTQGKANTVGTRTRAAQANKKAQTGVAIITALLVVALSAILVSGILWRQQVQIRRIENQRLLSQAQWISRGALDWTRLILRSEGDTSAGITYLGGVWGVPIAKTRLSDFLGQIGEVRAAEGAETYLSGSIEDAQSRFNLRNLVSSPAPGMLQLNVSQIQSFQRLLSLLGLNSSAAQNAAIQVRNSLAHSATRFQTTALTSPYTAPAVVGGAVGGNNFTDKPGISDDDNNPSVVPLQMTGVDSLLDVPGFSPDMVERLRPFVTYLPTTTAVNMNTAPAEVVAAVVEGMSLSNAQAFVARRQTVFFHNVGDVQLALQGAGVPQLSIDPSLYDVTTSYFFIHGRVDHERAEVDRTTLVYRDALTHTTRVVSVQDQL